MTVAEYLIGKMGKREFGQLMDGIGRIVHVCNLPDCARCELARNFDKEG